MSTVYQHQLHAHKIRRFHWKRWLAVSIVLIGLVVAGLLQLKPDTKITGAKTVTKTIAAQSPTQTFHKANFSVQLPRGWQFMGMQQDVYTIYHFRSALPGDAGNRLMDIYVDSSLPKLAINRMLPVEATEDGGLTANSSEVSDNCTAYTTDSANQSTVGQTAKWQGITFNCDMANTLRNVVGIGSTDGLNTVKINSLSSGPHHYFMTYTENNDKPDYSVFVAALNSFKVDQ